MLYFSSLREFLQTACFVEEAGHKEVNKLKLLWYIKKTLAMTLL